MFLGRENELASLRLLLEKPTASLVACRGRRRIGKSTLFKEFARRNRLELIVIEGLGPRKGQTNEDQLKNFGERLCAQTKGPAVTPENWMAAFTLLGERLNDRKKTVVLLDEISWMGRHDPDFPGKLKNGWDDVLKTHDNLILVICGSVSSWIQENLLESATFGGRFSRSLVLRELPLDLCVKFWRGAERRLSAAELADVLAVTGGVPRYLEEVNPALSADENIRRMCFTADGPLFKDFSAIFSEVFGSATLVKADILRALADGPLSCHALAARLGVERGGSLTRNLFELVEAGFVAKDVSLNPMTGKRSKLATYRICDNYTRFYLKYVEPHEEEIRAGHYAFHSLASLPGWRTIMGLQFENMVVNNVNALLPLLQLDGQRILAAAPYALRGDALADKGLQVDLLIQTQGAVMLVEVKHRQKIEVEVVEEVARKVRLFPKRRNVSLRTALVYEGDLAPSVRTSGSFDRLVPFAELLGKD